MRPVKGAVNACIRSPPNIITKNKTWVQTNRFTHDRMMPNVASVTLALMVVSVSSAWGYIQPPILAHNTLMNPRDVVAALSHPSHSSTLWLRPNQGAYLEAAASDLLKAPMAIHQEETDDEGDMSFPKLKAASSAASAGQRSQLPMKRARPIAKSVFSRLFLGPSRGGVNRP